MSITRLLAARCRTMNMDSGEAIPLSRGSCFARDIGGLSREAGVTSASDDNPVRRAPSIARKRLI